MSSWCPQEQLYLYLYLYPFSVHVATFSLITNFMHLFINPLNAELNPICHLLALLGAHPILHISRIKVKNYHHSHLKLHTLKTHGQHTATDRNMTRYAR
jgi:hypothetical protein